jgi:hypothetical protein
MHSNLNRSIAPSVMLATILALGITFAWIAAMAFPAIIIEPWLPVFVVREIWFVLGALLSPLMVFIATFIYAAMKGNGIPLHALWHPFVFMPFLILFAISILLSIRTYKRHLRLSETDAIVWAIFVFLWGVPGYIGYLIHCRWPVMERCSTCIKETPRDRDDCLHCHTPFPPPARVGTEIFA